MRDYARLQTAILLRRLAYELSRVPKHGADADSVHDLRVSIRRFSGCLRTFADFYPAHARKRIRKRLRVLMEAAGEVRDRDISAEILTQCGLPADSPIFEHLKEERRDAVRRLTGEVHQWKRHNFSREWRDDLGI